MAVHSRFLKILPALAAALFAACSGDITTPVPEFSQVANRDRVPERVFEVNISQARNNCNITEDIGSFDFFALPRHVVGNSYNLLFVLDSVVPAKFTGYRLTFAVPITLEDGVVTLGADWRFSKDRQSFTGATTFDVRANNGNTCLFTFATAGKPSVIPAGPINPPPAGQAAAFTTQESFTSAAHSAALSTLLAATYPAIGFFGPRPDLESSCFAISGQGSTDIRVDPPGSQFGFLHARNTDDNVEEKDWMLFRYKIVYSPDVVTAYSRLNGYFTQLGYSEGIIAYSNYYWYHASDGPRTPLPPVLLSNPLLGDRANAPWQRSGDAAQFRDVDGHYTVSIPGYYFVVYDIYWYPRDGFPRDQWGVYPTIPAWGLIQIPVSPSDFFCTIEGQGF